MMKINFGKIFGKNNFKDKQLQSEELIQYILKMKFQMKKFKQSWKMNLYLKNFNKNKQNYYKKIKNKKKLNKLQIVLIKETLEY